MNDARSDGTWEKLEFHDRKVLFRPDRNRIVEVDDIAFEVWDLLHVGMEKAEIVHRLDRKHDAGEVGRIIADLQALEIAPGPPDPNVATHAPPKNPKRKLSAWLQVAQECNLRCDYCFAGHGTYGRQPRLMPWETAKETVDWLVAAAEESGCDLHLSFFGGEPLLNMKTIRKIVEYCDETGASVAPRFSLSTNGTLLDGENVDFIRQHGISLLLSIDGPRQIHDRHRVYPDGRGSFRRVMDNYERYLAPSGIENCEVSAAYGRDDPNLVERVRFFRMHGFRNIGLDPLVIDPDHSCAFREEDLSRLEREFLDLSRFYAHEVRKGDRFRVNPLSSHMKMLSSGTRRKARCFAGRRAFSISAEGELFPCPQLASREEHLMGSISLGIDPGQIRRWEDSEELEGREGCPTCWARNLCGGGCRAESSVYNGDITTPCVVGCGISRIVAKASIWLCCEFSSEGNTGDPNGEHPPAPCASADEKR